MIIDAFVSTVYIEPLEEYDKQKVIDKIYKALSMYHNIVHYTYEEQSVDSIKLSEEPSDMEMFMYKLLNKKLDVLKFFIYVENSSTFDWKGALGLSHLSDDIKFNCKMTYDLPEFGTMEIKE